MKFSEAQVELARIEAALNKRYAGKRAVITSSYNGQPYGRSRPSMLGKTVVIEDVIVSDSILVVIEGESVALRPDELEVEDE